MNIKNKRTKFWQNFKKTTIIVSLLFMFLSTNNTFADETVDTEVKSCTTITEEQTCNENQNCSWNIENEKCQNINQNVVLKNTDPIQIEDCLLD